MAQQILFSIFAVITLVSAFVVVTDRNLFHAAIAMMLSFVGVAGFYVLLNSGFMAAAQLLVYIGAISIVIIFAIMMTRRMMSATEQAMNSQAIGAALASLMTFGLFAFIFYTTGVTGTIMGHQTPPSVSNELLDGTVTAMGTLLVSETGYVLPFELVSVLLLAALVGAIVIARPESGEEE